MEGSLSMTCMKLNRKPSKPNPPTLCNCMITLNNNNEKEKSRSLFSFKALYFHTQWSRTVRVFGRKLYISGRGEGAGRGVGMGNRLLPFFIHEIKRRGPQRGGQSVIGHIDLTFIIHLSRGN